MPVVTYKYIRHKPLSYIYNIQTSSFISNYLKFLSIYHKFKIFSSFYIGLCPLLRRSC